MQLNEILKNCLRALDSRDTHSVLDINEAVPGLQRFLASACPPFADDRVATNQYPAGVVRTSMPGQDEQERAMYLLEHSAGNAGVLDSVWRERSITSGKTRVDAVMG